MDYHLDLHANSFRSLELFVLALANYGLMYLANMMLARRLSVGEFDDYNVAVSVVTLLSTLATLGLEKYALRAVALLRDREDWPRFRGFWLFALRAIGAFSLLLVAVLGISLESFLALNQAEAHIAIVVFAVFLPIIAVTLFLVEFIAAHGAQLLSVTIYRLFLPAIYLVLLIGLSVSPVKISALAAVLCFGGAWTITLAMMWTIAKLLMPVGIKGMAPVMQGRKWLRGSWPLVLSSLMLTVMTSGGVIILEILFPSGLEVGIYAVAAQTGGFISLIGTSTNRYYLPMMVVMIGRGDKQAIRALMAQRTFAVGSLILALLAILIFAGRSILDLFGEQFSAGYHPMLLIACGACFSALFADIPYYLQFMGLHRIVLSMTLVAMIIMVTLSFVLGAQFGSLGVAAAYMTAVMLLFASLRIAAKLHFRRLSG
ncbi:lipopolysaccharide biosynthesis protein [Methylobacter sp. YRD-M1]|uniref:lipopolysaccharide biosynthesis protein n=1 Tax=Methylobacter sp. YRD-M1 TaxID=2911520 RepID=UPI00227C7AEA|nr:oligosaccharide flippase family protein [Methylobacter sp. YRD-M1]WAK02582.1 oligosaccharide flippase family protein [Methylobacter sp. YRD-M1]